MRTGPRGNQISFGSGVVATSSTFGIELDTNAIVEALAAGSSTKLAKWAQEAFPRSGESARSDLAAIIRNVNSGLAEDVRKEVEDLTVWEMLALLKDILMARWTKVLLPLDLFRLVIEAYLLICLFWIVMLNSGLG
jgi:hypothetical protein